MYHATLSLRKICLIIVNMSLLTLLLYQPGLRAAQPATGYIDLVRVFEVEDLASFAPADLLYLNTANRLLLVGTTAAIGNAPSQPAAALLTPYEDLVEIAALPANLDLTNIVYDGATNTILFSETVSRQRLQVTIQPNGLPDWSAPARTTGALQRSDIRGLAIDNQSRLLYLLTPDGLLVQQLGENATTSELATIALDHAQLTGQQLRGLAFHPQTNHLFTFAPDTFMLYEFATNGALVTQYDLAPFGLSDPQGFVFAPSGDQTDAEGTLNLYLVDRQRTLAPNLDGGVQEGISGSKIVELTFTAPKKIVGNVPTDMGTLITTVNTWEFSPPSPDPSGIAYMPPNSPFLATGNHLLITDGEVNEMDIYAGANVFETTLSGTLMLTYTTYPTISGEPVGASINPHNGHLFLTDDTGDRLLIEIDPGPDKTYLTTDDLTTTLSVKRIYGNEDPEGVEYARIGGVDTLFIADGLNSEVYIITPGPDGLFDGIDDTIANFDTKALGVKDPEGIAYDVANDTLYLIGDPPTRVAEVTTDGSLLRYVDIAAANADKPAGLTFAPGSQDAGTMHLYIVDRNVDNNSDPDENDGELYEVKLPSAGNRPPVVNAGDDMTVNWSEGAMLTATITDDGLPAPPATVVVTWTMESGPGTVIFSDANAAATTATFSIPGTYTLRITADDSEFSSSDTIEVQAEEINLPPTVDAGADQVIELSAMAILSATVMDDGLPLTGTLTTAWRKVSGPGNVTFADRTQLGTTATFDAIGDYVLRIRADDGEYRVSDALTVTVLADNTPPIVDAGNDQLVGHDDTTILRGTVTDDGLPDPPGSYTLTWSKEAGPGAVAFSTPDNFTTTVSFTAIGLYVIALEANDGAVSSTDTVTVTVGPPNQPPMVDAGINQTVTQTGTVPLQATVLDDGIPNPPGQVAVEWRLQSGPAGVSFADANVLTTTVTFTATGIYILELRADDGKRQATDTVAFNVGRENSPPAIVLGIGPRVIETKSTELEVIATDEWIPAPSGELTYLWRKSSGPSTVSFGTPQMPTTTVTFEQSGIYTIEIAVSDGELTTSGTIVVEVLENQAPSVHAGEDQTISASGTVTLTGVITDDGLPSGNSLSITWAQRSGPASAVIADATSLRTTVELVESGVYQFELAATDGLLTSSDTVTITVDSGTQEIFLPIIIAPE